MKKIIYISWLFIALTGNFVFASQDINEEKQNLKKSNILSLPQEIIVEVIDYLDKEDFISFKMTCKKFLSLSQDPKLLLPSLDALIFIRDKPKEAFKKLLRISQVEGLSTLGFLKETIQSMVSFDRKRYWVDYSNILKLGIKLRHIRFEEDYKTELERNCYNIQCAEHLASNLYTSPSELRTAYWEMLAYEDELARRWLIRAYEKKDNNFIKLDKERLEFWKSFNSDSIVTLPDVLKNHIFLDEYLYREYPFNKIDEKQSIDDLSFPLYSPGS